MVQPLELHMRFKPKPAKRKLGSRLAILPIDIYEKIYNMMYHAIFKDVMDDLKKNLIVHYDKVTKKSVVYFKGKYITYLRRSISPRSSSCQLIVDVWPNYLHNSYYSKKLCECEKQNGFCTDWLANNTY